MPSISVFGLVCRVGYSRLLRSSRESAVDVTAIAAQLRPEQLRLNLIKLDESMALPIVATERAR